jgi:hypothetical protein
MSASVGRAFVRRSSVIVMVVMVVTVVTVVASVTAVINPDLAADFAARRRRRMKVRIGGSVAQRADEIVERAGGNLLCS